MNLAQFVTLETGNAITFDSVPADTGQCVQLVESYCQKVLQAPVFYAPYAVDWWTEFERSNLQGHFQKVSPNSIRPGDIVVWGASNLINSPVAGHIDIALTSVVNGLFTGFDSNWGGVRNQFGYPVAHQVTHTLTDVLGALRHVTNAPPVLQPIYHNVIWGDTVDTLEDTYKFSIPQFKIWNPQVIDINKIYVGERLRVR